MAKTAQVNGQMELNFTEQKFQKREVSPKNLYQNLKKK